MFKYSLISLYDFDSLITTFESWIGSVIEGDLGILCVVSSCSLFSGFSLGSQLFLLKFIDVLRLIIILPRSVTSPKKETQDLSDSNPTIAASSSLFSIWRARMSPF